MNVVHKRFSFAIAIDKSSAIKVHDIIRPTLMVKRLVKSYEIIEGKL